MNKFLFKGFIDASFCIKTKRAKGALYLDDQKEKIFIFPLTEIADSEQAEFETLRISLEKLCKLKSITTFELSARLFCDCLPAIDKFHNILASEYPLVVLDYIPGKYNPAHHYCKLRK